MGKGRQGPRASARRRLRDLATVTPPSPSDALVVQAGAPSTTWQRALLAGQVFDVPGDALALSDVADPANALLAEYAVLRPGDRVVVLGVGCGLLAAWLARQVGCANVIVSDVHTSALDCAAQTLRRNGCDGFTLVPVDGLDRLAAGSLAAAFVNSAFQSSTRALDGALVELAQGLRVGGTLYVAGAKDRGIASIKARLGTLFGAAPTLGYRKGVHVVAAIRSSSLELVRSIARPVETVAVSVRGMDFHLGVRDGVFARGGLDDGTRLLLGVLQPNPTAAALDLGCGGGIVGMVLAGLAPDGFVDLVDSDVLAVGLARENLAAHGIKNAAVHAGDGLAAVPGRLFDLIACNPPFHLGRRQTTAVARRLIAEAWGALRPHGCFYVVANRFLPYERDIADVFGGVSEVAGDGRYKVLVGVRGSVDAGGGTR